MQKYGKKPTRQTAKILSKCKSSGLSVSKSEPERSTNFGGVTNVSTVLYSTFLALFNIHWNFNALFEYLMKTLKILKIKLKSSLNAELLMELTHYE